MYIFFLKRLIDLIISAAAFVLLFPFFLILTLLLLIANRGTPFFIQKRPGRNEKIFNVIKFRTMNSQTGSDGLLLPDIERITAIGGFIRNTSLDEIPQLLNVIKGDMSIIGPRPLLVEYLPLYNTTQRRRHEVRPGITGWAQVNGRNAISWQQKFDYDIWYIDNISLALDIKIIWMTLKKVFQSEGINASNSNTMEAFRGN